MIPTNEFTIFGQRIFTDKKCEEMRDIAQKAQTTYVDAKPHVRPECRDLYEVPNLEGIDYAEAVGESICLTKARLNERRSNRVCFLIDEGSVCMTDRWHRKRAHSTVSDAALEKSNSLREPDPKTFSISVDLDYKEGSPDDFPEGDPRRVLRNSRKEWHFFSEANYAAMMQQPFELSVHTTAWPTDVPIMGHHWEEINILRKMCLEQIEWLKSNPVVWFGKHIQARLPLKEGLHRLAADEWRQEYNEQKANYDLRIADPTFRSIKTKFGKAMAVFRELLNEKAYPDYDKDLRRNDTLHATIQFPIQKGWEVMDLPRIVFTAHTDHLPKVTKVTLMKNGSRYSRDALCSLLEGYASKAQTKKMLEASASGPTTMENDWVTKLLSQALLRELF